MSALVEASSEATKQEYRLPDQKTLQHATKLAIVDDKPIMLDYWTTPDNGDEILIGVKQNTENNTNEKILVKNAEEYTSPIVKIFKIDNTYIICTENSIYLTKSSIKSKQIS